MEIRCCLCLEGTRIIFEDEPGTHPDSTYKCLQGTVHVKRACFYVAVSALVLCLFSAVCIFFGVYSVNFYLDIALILLNAVVAIFVLIGLYGNKSAFLIPFIVSEIAQCIGFFILATYTLYYTIVIKRQRFYQKFDQILMVVSIYVGIIVCAQATWVTTRCYHYLRSRQLLTDCNNVTYSFWE
ncbi:hypothetical protein KIN20_021421 [Parelaphostrongylus tenuis]|uniref:Uncharacterized protein n=1 Tax=Parelaphostrongylus tenuis TaxID=148309 RepID=A0AAD5N7X2_PARTN|nr:hypothetical protein KIN20_021421 [Parelaphostrongylus tenuis]